jgi:hypothetical protein
MYLGETLLEESFVWKTIQGLFNELEPGFDMRF